MAVSLLTFGVLAGASLLAANPAQSAEPLPATRSVSEQPDVGVPGEGDATMGTPAVAPDGALVWSTPTSPRALPLSAATAQSWIAVTATADGARIRSRPASA